MRNKKIINLPKQLEINYVFDVHELHDLLKQTFEAGVNWEEEYYTDYTYIKDNCSHNLKQPDYIKYLKHITNEKQSIKTVPKN